MRGSSADPCGCFPTGRHYPGIADAIADAIAEVAGLCAEHDPSVDWRRIPIAVIDFETTGTSPTDDRIVEVGVVCFDQGEVTRAEAILVNPGRPIPESAARVHGISDEEVRDAPAFDATVPTLREWLSGRLPVAYNAGFDRSFLHAALDRARVTRDPDAPPAFREDVVWADPLVWAREILKDIERHRLVDVCAHLGVSLEHAHRAAGDAEATGRVLMALAPKMPTAYAALIRLQERYRAVQEAEFARLRGRRRR